MTPEQAFQNLANFANWAVQRGGVEIHQVVAIHESLTALATVAGAKPAAQAPAVIEAPEPKGEA